MQRFHQLIFVASLLALSWFAMMAVHEFGHVIGALTTGGAVERVVLHPLTISRTDVSPNPNPSIVVWLGPILGCIIPAAIWGCIPHCYASARNIAAFFAGFCLLANGAYIAIGSFDRVGDCGVMLQHGSPLWTLLAFGLVTIPLGFYLWHRLGSVRQFIADPSLVDPIVAYALLGALLVMLALELTISPR
ncbi:hypothetical protein Pla22_47340 [Rubripirellula amarantea]|uniref:Peptidase family M50 n=1 Tax=Rubripirellula amarantea TaxID=2527999 RepID=A0A5C5WG75_9BACT|nr:hypothetical protein [Rubripirellula amarantea]TWT49537.1 hypothetical protein Pla22_47340 [Rubripirellula amarantea]